MLDVTSLVKYLLEGAAVAAAAYYIPKKTSNLKEVAIIALTAAAVFAVLDMYAPLVLAGARHGAGFGIGYNLVGGDEAPHEEADDTSSVSAPSEPEPNAAATEGFADVE